VSNQSNSSIIALVICSVCVIGGIAARTRQTAAPGVSPGQAPIQQEIGQAQTAINNDQLPEAISHIDAAYAKARNLMGAERGASMKTVAQAYRACGERARAREVLLDAIDLGGSQEASSLMTEMDREDQASVTAWLQQAEALGAAGKLGDAQKQIESARQYIASGVPKRKQSPLIRACNVASAQLPQRVTAH
jgi:thermostable 8-oxoguanine DNA glycosylase